MSSYVEAAIEARGDLPLMSTRTLEVIATIDEAVVKISNDLDKAATALRGKAGISKNKRKDLEAMHTVAELLSERKAQVAVKAYDLMNQHINIIDQEIKILEKAMRMNGDERLKAVIGPVVIPKVQVAKRGRRSEYDEEMVTVIDPSFAIDPNEPVYCICRQIAFGEMIACDNEECAIEWFHYPCVNLVKQPRSTWLCPDCSRRRRGRA